jgi:hypothetical protein
MRKVILAVCASVLILSACSGRQIKNVSVPTLNKSAAQVETGILTGCKDRGWICSKVSDGLIEALLQKGRHSLTVNIPYEKGGYKIIYKDSINLDYSAKKHTIHKAYYKWIIYLNKSIHAALVNPEKYAAYEF